MSNRLNKSKILGIALLTMASGATLGLEIDLGQVGKLFSNISQLSRDVSEEEEIEIGEKLVSGLLGAAPLVENPALQQYVNDVGLWIARQSSRKDLPWAFAVIDSEGINAFAAPGGYIVITAGLYRLLENEAQLAGVLAHEISHVVEKHHLIALEETLEAEVWTGLALLAADNAEDRNKANRLVNTGLQIYTSGLDQEYEFDADLRGVVLAARAGYDPYALLDVLTTIESINPEAEELLVFTKTHPPAGERLSILAENMDGKLDAYATGQSNSTRFRESAVAQ